jgi:hypothetical protein
MPANSMFEFLQTFSNRFIGHQTHHVESPTLVIFGGIHGNEQAGVKALQKVCDYIEDHQIPLKGNFYAIKGNLQALERNERYIDLDLNRLWTEEVMQDFANLQESDAAELKEAIELKAVIKEILDAHSGPFYFLDIHTTSSFSTPFITISDSLNNRRFAAKFNIPTVLGIEEYLEGPLLTYLNEFGHVSLGFEAGQHKEESSVMNSIDFIWKSLRFSNCISKQHFKSFERRKLQKHPISIFFHIVYRYSIQPNERFFMRKGYTNFKNIKKGTPLALSNGSSINSPCNGFIFMPLYQKQGNDGFFIVCKISLFWMGLSILLRKLDLHFALPILPGVRRLDVYTLQVDPKITLFFSEQIFHLLGYRKKVKKEGFWQYTRRDRKIKPFQ